MNSPDAELIARCKTGERSAFDLLMERYQGEIVGLSFQLLGYREEAVELAQEAFFRAWQGLPKFREEAAFRTWLYQITINLARNRRRWYARHKTAKTVSLDAPMRADAESGSMLEQVADPAQNPGEVAARTEQIEAVRRGIDQLQEPFRTVLLLRDIQGLPYEEVAETIRQPIGTVRSRLHRARKMLKTTLDQEDN